MFSLFGIIPIAFQRLGMKKKKKNSWPSLIPKVLKLFGKHMIAVSLSWRFSADLTGKPVDFGYDLEWLSVLKYLARSSVYC